MHRAVQRSRNNAGSPTHRLVAAARRLWSPLRSGSACVLRRAAFAQPARWQHPVARGDARLRRCYDRGRLPPPAERLGRAWRGAAGRGWAGRDAHARAVRSPPALSAHLVLTPARSATFLAQAFVGWLSQQTGKPASALRVSVRPFLTRPFRDGSAHTRASRHQVGTDPRLSGPALMDALLAGLARHARAAISEKRTLTALTNCLPCSVAAASQCAWASAPLPPAS